MRISNLEKKREEKIYLEEKELLSIYYVVVLSAFFVCLDGGICRYQSLRCQAGVEAPSRHRYVTTASVTGSGRLRCLNTIEIFSRDKYI